MAKRYTNWPQMLVDLNEKSLTKCRSQTCRSLFRGRRIYGLWRGIKQVCNRPNKSVCEDGCICLNHLHVGSEISAKTISDISWILCAVNAWREESTTTFRSDHKHSQGIQNTWHLNNRLMTVNATQHSPIKSQCKHEKREYDFGLTFFFQRRQGCVYCALCVLGCV